ncbi:MAG: hypothetical protein EU549_03920 [Promethearchaeota archaeon]|nr:MAG: hypothetical protein EU549_03920 [Candidatus Lokiarchaeota archaeon]
MEENEKIVLKISNEFLIAGIIGLVNFLLVIIFIALDFLYVISFPYSDILSSAFGLVISILIFDLMFNGLKEIGIENSINMKYFSWSKILIIFYPISSALLILIYLVALPVMISLIVFIIFITSIVLSFISLLLLGIYMYKIGKEINHKTVLIGGLLIILSGLTQIFLIPFIWIACILLFIGFRKYLFQLSI